MSATRWQKVEADNSHWEIELSDVHAHAGLAMVRASYNYAGQAGDVCQTVWLGRATEPEEATLPGGQTYEQLVRKAAR